MLATLDQLGVRASFSRPGVSADNAFSEALFRTTKYRPDYPAPFDSLEQARAWVDAFVAWYNHEHRHSALRFVTLDDRHHGRDAAILAARDRVYAEARQRHPDRWSGRTRNWKPIGPVRLGFGGAAKAGRARGDFKQGGARGVREGDCDNYLDAHRRRCRPACARGCLRSSASILPRSRDRVPENAEGDGGEW